MVSRVTRFLFRIEYFLDDLIIHMYTECAFRTQGVMKGSCESGAERVSNNEMLPLKTSAWLYL